MKTAVVTLHGIAPYSPSRNHNLAKLEKESHDAYEKRTWSHRLHTSQDGKGFIPPMGFKKAIERAAAMLREKIPGKGSSEWGKHFKAGTLVTEGLPLNVTVETVEGEWLFLNADGKSGGSKRVWRCMPCVREWSGKLTYFILDDTITKEIFERYVRESGRFIGVGRFRPENGGYYGRFEVDGVEWT